MSPPKRKKWDPEMMIRAVRSVRSKEMGYKRAAKYFGVPKGTLERYVKDEKSPEELVKINLGRKPILTTELETELVNYCIQMDSRFYGLRKKDIKRIAFQLAIRNGLKHPFSEDKKSAGKKWLRGFLKRHPELSIRSPESTSFARIKGFNPESVEQFFNLYEPELQKINSRPHRLFNVDETGITVVQHKNSKVISLKGKKNVGSLTSAERGCLITIVMCMNAVGTYVPPLIVWPRKNMKDDLMDGAPAGSIAACHPSGWIQTDIFTMWFDHFIKFVKPTKDDPVLLVLDGHNSHTRNISVLETSRKHFVTIICLPPHSSHRMQPLDVGFMFPLQTYYAQEVEDWLHQNPNKVITNFKVARLFNSAYNRAATMENSVNSFKKTGLFPCNRHIFRDYDFEISNSSSNRQQDATEELKPSTSNGQDNRPEPEPQPSSSSEDIVKPCDISPIPQLPSTSKSSRCGSANVLTSTPYKNKLIESLEKSKKIGKVGIKPKNLFDSKKQPIHEKRKDDLKVKGPVKRRQQLVLEESEDSEEEIFSVHDSSDDDDDDDAECLFCGCFYSQDKHGEAWRQCLKCFQWAHEDCGADAHFVCPICMKKK